jgi:hypothetical protein
MKYRGENLVENSVNEECRGWDLENIAGDSLSVTIRAGVARARVSGEGPPLGLVANPDELSACF